MVCKELPAELWGIIAKELKRDPPPAGTKANWNDHFHQQDLVNLQRVNKHLYRVVSPNLYHTPIVHNVGLFILGVERPRPILIRDKEGKNHESIPYHKRTLLDTVKKLYIVNASSRIPVQDCFMLGYSRKRYAKVPLKGCRADRLGQMDLDGWTLAERVSTLAKLSRWHHAIAFRHLSKLAIGAWDDGRWKQYERSAYNSWLGQPDDTSSESSESDGPSTVQPLNKPARSSQNGGKSIQLERNVAPTGSVKDILERILFRTRLEHICGRPGPLFDHMDRTKGRKIHHESTISNLYLLDESPIRLYTTTAYFKTADHRYIVGYQIGGLILRCDAQKKPVFLIPPESDDESGDGDLISLSEMLEPKSPDLELCIAPEVIGDKRQLEAAREIKEALETFRQKDETTKEYAEIYLTKFKILVGDEVPPCPCCGLSR